MKIINITIFVCFLNNFIISQDFSVRFDGINDYAYILDHPDLDLTSNYTLEAWIFPESFSWLSGIISKYHSNASNGFILRLNQQPPYTGIGFDELETNNGILNNNEWFHIAAVKNSNDRKLYVNGIEVNLQGNALNINSNNDPVRIASDYSGRFFQGRIDEVRIWNQSRTSEQIISTMDTILNGNEFGLVAYYNFNEGTGDTLFDLTANNHIGILMGNPLWIDGQTVSGILGDINFDEILNIYDAVKLVSILLDNSIANDQQLILSDTNQDGSIDIDDIVLLIQWILDIESIERNRINNFYYKKNNNSIFIESDGDMAAFSIQLKQNFYLEDNFSMPNGWLYKQENNKIIGFSMDGSSLPLNFKIDFKQKPLIENISISDWSGNIKTNNKNFSIDTFNLFPNPFNSECKIVYTLNYDGSIKLEIFNINGHQVNSFKKEYLNKGIYSYSWMPKNLPSGIYLIRLSYENSIINKKVLYLK